MIVLVYTGGLPDGVSPSSLMGRQFHGILAMIDKVANNIYSDKFSDRKDKEKEKFDMKHSRELKPLLVGSTVSYLMYNISYHIKAENGHIISHNRVHLHETNVEFVPQVQNIPKVSKEEKTVKSSNFKH